jgi:hypothetical protein
MNYPMVNGHRYSFSSIEVDLDGRQHVGWSAVNFTDTLEPGIVRGTHAQILGRTRGDYTCEASLTGYVEEINEFLADLGDGWMERIFDVTVTFAEANGPTHTVEIRQCRIQSIAHAHAQGTDPLSVDMTLHPLVIIREGMNPLAEMLTGATAPSNQGLS